jgi:hypothetical protein
MLSGFLYYLCCQPFHYVGYQHNENVCPYFGHFGNKENPARECLLNLFTDDFQSRTLCRVSWSHFYYSFFQYSFKNVKEADKRNSNLSATLPVQILGSYCVIWGSFDQNALENIWNSEKLSNIVRFVEWSGLSRVKCGKWSEVKWKLVV